MGSGASFGARLSGLKASYGDEPVDAIVCWIWRQGISTLKAELHNVVQRRFLRLGGSIWIGAWVSLGLAGGELIVLGAAGTFYWFWLFAGPTWVARVAGHLWSQTSVVADDLGLHYGPNFVPWVSVTGGRCRPTVLHRGKRCSLLAPEWSSGFRNRLVRRHGLPLSRFDRQWRENDLFVKALRRYLSPDICASIGI